MPSKAIRSELEATTGLKNVSEKQNRTNPAKVLAGLTTLVLEFSFYFSSLLDGWLLLRFVLLYLRLLRFRFVYFR